MSIPEFGIKRQNEERRDGGCGVIFDPKTQKYAVGEKIEGGLLILFGGGVDSKEDILEGVKRELKEESGLYDFSHMENIGETLCHYFNNSKNVNRVAHATCFIFILQSRNLVPTKLEEHEKFILVWKTPKEIFENWDARNKDKDYDHWIYFLEKAVARAKELGYDTSTS